MRILAGAAWQRQGRGICNGYAHLQQYDRDVHDADVLTAVRPEKVGHYVL